MNAPMMKASWAVSASTARPRTITSAAIVSVVPVRENRSVAVSKRGTASTPTTPDSTRKPSASSSVEATPPTVTLSPLTTLTTTVRMIRPMTSSATAAPSTTRASVVARARRSPNTRAVMPTLVAVSAAPMNSAVSVSRPSPIPATVPPAKGTATPMIATSIDARPTRPSSARSISMPTCTSSRSTPSSASTPRLTPRSPVTSTRPRTDGPTKMPTTISPSTAGSPTRSAPSAASFAAAITTSRSSSSLARSRCSNGDVVSAQRRHEHEGSRQDLRVEPPPASPDGDDRVRPEGAADADECGVAAAVVEVAEAGVSPQPITVDDLAAAVHERAQHGELSRPELHIAHAVQGR